MVVEGSMSIRKTNFNYYNSIERRESMEGNQSQPLILVYYKVRGKMQPIRNLACYLNLKVCEVSIDSTEEERKSLCPLIMQKLKGHPIDKTSLPLLVFEGLLIYETYPIMAYICRRFKHQELLGRDVRQKARLQQILEPYFNRQAMCMKNMFCLSDWAADKSKDEIAKQKRIYFEKYMNESNYIKQICQYLEKQKSNCVFVFQTITIVDFLFLECCIEMLGMFNSIDERKRCKLSQIIDFFTNEPTDTSPNIKYLETMRNYLDFMLNQPFYVKNKEYLESLTLKCKNLSSHTLQGLRNIWCMNPKLVE